MRLLYLVHDLEDDAVLRRRRFLRHGGADVSLIGFHRLRGTGAPARLEGLAIGETRNARLLSRAMPVARAVIGAGDWREDVRGADIIVARNLEMLLIAVLVRRRLGLAIPIVYECLDIHRLMTKAGPACVLLRRLERRLLKSCALLIVSSPKFIEAHFARYGPHLPRWTLLENKLAVSEFDASQTARPPAIAAGPPWRIGWFGVIRCRRSLALLAALARASGGAIEVEIRGRPALDTLPDFETVVTATRGLSFHGPYDRATDLATIYGRVHFNWAIDYYEDGLNSAWLLPNRLYEGSAFGAVPLALREVETGKWLARQQCGLLLDSPAELSLPALFASMTQPTFHDAQRRMAALDPSLLVESSASAACFVAKLGQLRGLAGIPAGQRRMAG